MSRKLPYGSRQANVLAVNLNGGDVNAVSSYCGTSPLSTAVARNREVRGLGRLREGNRDVPRSAEVLRTDPETTRQPPMDPLGVKVARGYGSIAKRYQPLDALGAAGFPESKVGCVNGRFITDR